MSEQYILPGLKKYVSTWCKQCNACQRAKIQRHTKLPHQRIDMPDSRFDHIHLDMIVLPKVGQWRYCLTIIDRFSRWPVVVPLADIEADTVAKAMFNNWICHYGTPLTITTDQGTQFESALFRLLAKVVGAKVIHTTPYHPQANGIIERFHRTLENKNTLKAALMCHPTVPWPEALPTVLLGLRTCLKQDMKISPAEILYGTTLRVPGAFIFDEDETTDVHKFFDKHRELMQNLRPTPTAIHAKNRCFKIKELDTCSHVFRRVDSVRAPLEAPYTGPHEIIKRINDRVFLININGKEKTVSTEQLKPAYEAKLDDDDNNLRVLPPTRTYSKKVSFARSLEQPCH